METADGKRRGAAVAELVDVVSAQLRLALEEGELQWTGDTVNVLVAVDAPGQCLGRHSERIGHCEGIVR